MVASKMLFCRIMITNLPPLEILHPEAMAMYEHTPRPASMAPLHLVCSWRVWQRGAGKRFPSKEVLPYTWG
jgi:hypothetical protein